MFANEMRIECAGSKVRVVAQRKLRRGRLSVAQAEFVVDDQGQLPTKAIEQMVESTLPVKARRAAP